MIRHFKPKYLAGSIAAAFFALDSSLAFAALEEVIVTARKREESLQDVPVVVQALSADSLEAMGTAEFSDLNDQISGLSIYAGGPTQPSVNLRGIQGNAINPGTDEAISINLDGVQHSSSQLFRFGLFELESVEVLKGPQALFFGKNSPGGIIAMRTKNPTDELFTELQVGYEEAGERTYGHAIVSGPISDTWGGRLGVRMQNADGFFENVWGQGDASVTQPADRTGPDFDEIVAVGTLRGEFDRGDVSFKVYRGERDGNDYNQIQIYRCNDTYQVLNPYEDCELNDKFSAAPFSVDPSSSRVADDEHSYEYEMTQISLEVNYEINDTWEFNNILGWVDMENYFFGNLGARTTTFPNSLFAGQLAEMDQITEEFRFSGDFDNFRFMFGAFVDDRTLKTTSKVWLSEVFPFSPDGVTEIGGESWSVFAQTDIDLTEQLELSIGARYTEEDRDYKGENLDSSVFAPAGTHQVVNPELEYTNLSPELTLSWQPADNVTLFGSYKEGFKSGGYNVVITDTMAGAIAPIENDFEREDVSGYELGFKLQLLDDTLRINGALFTYDYTELQQSAFFETDGVISTRTVNAGEALMEGFEVDLLWQTPWELLTVSANLAFNDNQFDNYAAECNEFQRFVDSTGCNVNLDGITDPSDPNFSDTTDDGDGTLLEGTGVDAQDRSGHPLRRAPEWSGSIGLNFDAAVTETVRFKANLMSSYSDDYMANGENNPWGIQDSYWIYNANLGIYAEDGSWSLDLIGRNLSDEAVALTVYDNSATSVNGEPEALNVSRNAPREIMLQFTFRPDLFL